MKRAVDLAYRALAELARGAALLAPPGQSKVLRSLRARRGIRARYRAWGDQHRDLSRPLLWMHAPSVGEGLQAQPVLNLMRSRRPTVQLAYTHYSPSAASFAASLPAPPAHRLIARESARNHFPGIVTRVVKDAVMAQVEIQAGPHRVVSLLSREAVDELGLEPGVRAVASVKATNVVIEVPE